MNIVQTDDEYTAQVTINCEIKTKQTACFDFDKRKLADIILILDDSHLNFSRHNYPGKSLVCSASDKKANYDDLQSSFVACANLRRQAALINNRFMYIEAVSGKPKFRAPLTVGNFCRIPPIYLHLQGLPFFRNVCIFV